MNRRIVILGIIAIAGLLVWALLSPSGPTRVSEEGISFFDLPIVLQGIWAASGTPKDLEFYRVEWAFKTDRLTNAEIAKYAKRSLKGDVTIVKLVTQAKTYIALVYRNQFQTDKLDQALSKVFVKLNEKPPVYAVGG